MKSILVHTDASERAAARLALAQRLASRHAAEVQVLYGVVPSLLAAAWGGGEVVSLAASMLADLDREYRARARAAFDRAAVQGRLGWVDGGSQPYWSLLQHALHADLVVLGQADADDRTTGVLPADMVTSCILDAGRPVLVMPRAGTFDALPPQVLVGWKPTREAARALGAALPWLRLATTVHLALPADDSQAAVDHGAALVHWLELQGVGATVRRHRVDDGDAGPALLSLAADTGSGLLVMGCYGHGRARESVLGGASRSVLRTMDLPVLMVH